jgi:hypothetical protein
MDIGVVIAQSVCYVACLALVLTIGLFIKPCYEAIISGLNFITEEVIAQMIHYYTVQIGIYASIQNYELHQLDGDTLGANKVEKSRQESEDRYKQANMTNRVRRIKPGSSKKSSALKLFIPFLVLLIFQLLLFGLNFLKNQLFLKQYGSFNATLFDINDLYMFFQTNMLTYQTQHYGYFETLKPYLNIQLEYYNRVQKFEEVNSVVKENFRSLYFTNTCQLLKGLVTLSEDDFNLCNKLYRGSLVNGLKSFIENSNNRAQSYLGLRGEPEPITKDDLASNRLSVEFLTYAMDLIFRRVNDETIRVNDLALLLDILTVCITFFFLIVQFVMLRSFIRNSINVEYSKVKKYYEHFIPEDIVNNEKRFRAELKNSGVINN